jgi:hypothetical protein
MNPPPGRTNADPLTEVRADGGVSSKVRDLRCYAPMMASDTKGRERGKQQASQDSVVGEGSKSSAPWEAQKREAERAWYGAAGWEDCTTALRVGMVVW